MVVILLLSFVINPLFNTRFVFFFIYTIMVNTHTKKKKKKKKKKKMCLSGHLNDLSAQ